MFVYVAQEKLRDQGGGEFIGVRKLMRVMFLRSSFSIHNSHKATIFFKTSWGEPGHVRSVHGL